MMCLGDDSRDAAAAISRECRFRLHFAIRIHSLYFVRKVYEADGERRLMPVRCKRLLRSRFNIFEDGQRDTMLIYDAAFDVFTQTNLVFDFDLPPMLAGIE